MPDNVKFLVYEVNGSELEFPEERQFLPSEMPFSDPSYIADNVEAAIKESASTGGQSRYVVSCGYSSTVQNGRWLEFHRGNPSDDMPYIATEATEIISVSVSIPDVETSVTFSIYKNAVLADTLIITNNSKASKTLTTPISLVAGDEISVQKTAGNNAAAATFYPHFKIPF